MAAQAAEQSQIAAQGYRVRRAGSAQEMAAVMALRRARFGVGEDRFDAESAQIMVTQGDQLLATFRLRSFENGAQMAHSYSAQYYDLADLARMQRPALELGRFCQRRETTGEADVLRLAFAAMAARVDAMRAGLLFGCSSFAGAAVAPHRASLSLLKDYKSRDWTIAKKLDQAVDLNLFSHSQDEAAAALRHIPPLLRSYLSIGGWVSGHAVQDLELNTLHVFTAVEVDKIPPPRAKALRALAAQLDMA